MQRLVDKSIQVASLDFSSYANRGEVFLVPFLFEHIGSVFSAFKVPLPFKEMRCAHYRTIILPFEGNTYVLADQRHSPYLKRSSMYSQLVVQKVPELVAIRGDRGISCSAVCVNQRKACRQDQFDYINNCESLIRHFSCERGCKNDWGNVCHF